MNREPCPVTITAARASCACTTFDAGLYTSRSLAPGEQLTLRGEVAVGERIGRRSESIDLLLDTGAFHSTALEFEVYATYSVKPEQLAFMPVNLDEPDDEVLGVVVFSSPTVQLIGAPKADVPWLVAALEEAAPGESKVLVRVLKHYLPYGEQYGRIVLETSDSGRPRCHVAVRCLGTAALRPVPAHLLLRPGERGVVRFLTPDGVLAAVKSVQAHEQRLECGIAPDGTAVEIRVVAELLERPERVTVTTTQDQHGAVLVSLVR